MINAIPGNWVWPTFLMTTSGQCCVVSGAATRRKALNRRRASFRSETRADDICLCKLIRGSLADILMHTSVRKGLATRGFDTRRYEGT